ncbi:MAG: hypothetical protein JNL11_03635 [Bdellovibrionaceae bacterium]|nr:hypothetical protein [Pseudobdellovibrionaceae bacterium]
MSIINSTILVFMILAWSVLGFGQKSCLNFYKTSSKFEPWSLLNNDEFENLTEDMFFPPAYLAKLKSRYKMKFSISKSYDPARGANIGHFRFARNYDEPLLPPVMKFYFWQGSDPKSVVVEGLKTADLLNETTRKAYRGGRTGLPRDVFYHATNSIYNFLRAGGFKKIEIRSSQNLLVYLLYQKVLGAVPANEHAGKMSQLIQEIIRATLTEKLFGDEVKSVADITHYLGGATVTTTTTPMTDIWTMFPDKERATKMLEKFGAKKILNSNKDLIGFKRGSSAFFIVPFLPGSPVLDWQKIYINHAEYLMLEKNITQAGKN